MSSFSAVRWLFLDLDSYFASVEQQTTPALRGKPVAVVPMRTDSTCCIAASYEAKAFGIKTGTAVYEAKRLCPSLRLVEARHGLYIQFHHAVVEAVNTCVPVESILSIDEMICRLLGSQQEMNRAMELAQKIKAVIRERVGLYVRCSIGLAPNRFLAKLASDRQKPDGLTVIRLDDLPQALFPLALQDFPGIGRRMEKHLHQAGIYTTKQLCSLSKSQMASVWGGIVGERFWAWLNGQDTMDVPTHRRSVGHSHVLEPALRSREGGFRVAKKLLNKAALRLRRLDYWASHLALVVEWMDGGVWEAKTKLFEAQDTPTLFKTLHVLWEKVPPGKPRWVGVTLYDLVPPHRHIPSLFENPKKEKACRAMDQINDRYGRDTAYFASLHDARQTAPTRIAFTSVPDLSEVD